MAGMWGEYRSPVASERPPHNTASQQTVATQPASSKHSPAVCGVPGRGQRSERLEAGVVILSAPLTALTVQHWTKLHSAVPGKEGLKHFG